MNENVSVKSRIQISKAKIPFCGHLLFFLLFVSCKEIIRPLEISDLKLNQADWYSMIYNDKEILVANKIDTMFLVLAPDSDKKLILRWRGDVEYWTDTIGYYAYDDDGRILETVIFRLFRSNKYQYDSVGLIKEYQHISDIRDKAKMRHRFVPDSLLLYQYNYDYNDSNLVYFDVQFKFDKQGKVLEKKANYTNAYGKTIYQYNQSGQPIYMRSTKGGEEEGHRNYFYTNNKLDSIINISPAYIGELPIKLYYDERGLCYRKADGNTIINCVYKQRE